jgi:hypothetical protein
MVAAEIINILQSGSFEGLIGVVEDGHVDFKRAPYQLDTEYGKFELAKDVAAFANGRDAGVIVIGVGTEVPSAHGAEMDTRAVSPFERAAKVTPIPRGLLNEKQYRDVIRERCYPVPAGFTVTAYPPANDSERCLLAIHVSAQDERDRPYLVLRALEQEGAKLQGWLVGLPRRSLDDTEQARPGELHELIARGRNVAPRLEEIAVLMAQQHQQAQPESDSPPTSAASAHETAEARDEVETRVDVNPFGLRTLLSRAREATLRFSATSDQYGGQVVAPSLTLFARPRETIRIPSIFRGGDVRAVLENPPFTRQEGWNLRTLDSAEIVNGDHLRLMNGTRKAIEFYEDGSFIAIGRFDNLLVAGAYPWGADETKFLKVNSLALVEYIHDFVLAFAALVPFMEPRPASAAFGVQLLGATNWPQGKLFLPPYGIGTFGWETPMEATPPDKDDYEWYEVLALGDPVAVSEIALHLVERVYAFFKRQFEEIPYLNVDRDAVDPASFAAQR